MKKWPLFYINIILFIITLFFSLLTFSGVFNQIIEITAFEEVFEPEKALVILFYVLISTFFLGIILASFYTIIFIKFHKNNSLKVVPFNALLETEKVFLRCIFAFILLISIYGFNWMIVRDNDISYHLPFFILLPLCTYFLLNFTAMLQNNHIDSVNQ